MKNKAILCLEDGSIFNGFAIGFLSSCVGEVVFNTSMTGYQEILTDPSYKKQITTLTYPHIGNTGTTDIDNESSKVQAAGLVIKDLPIMASNWRSTSNLQDYLLQHKIVAIAGIDTRALTKKLRTQGSLRGCIQCGEDIDEKKALQNALDLPSLKGADLASQVSCKKTYDWHQTTWNLDQDDYPVIAKKDLKYKVVTYDFGIKHNILRILSQRGCDITVVPAKTPASKILKMNPDGIFLSNGPGDPAACSYAIDNIKTLMLKDNLPIFGICLGYQLLALSCGAKTYKMKFGHHGANHPVLDLQTKQVKITSQNHGFTVDEKSLPDALQPTHISLFDKSLQGVRHTTKPIFGFQGHPEASPGPHDIDYLFDNFITDLKNAKKN